VGHVFGAVQAISLLNAVFPVMEITVAVQLFIAVAVF